jgi:hypothetical protein
MRLFAVPVLIGFVPVLLLGCSHKRDVYYDEPERSRSHVQPAPRPQSGWTSNGRTWQDVGGGMRVIQPRGGGKAEIMME